MKTNLKFMKITAYGFKKIKAIFNIKISSNNIIIKKHEEFNIQYLWGEDSMIERISKKILNILSDDNDDEEQREILLFGITRIVEDIPKYVALITICAVLGIIKEFVIVMMVTAAYKTFTGGLHLHTNLGCFIGSLMSILTCIYLPELMEKYNYILIPFYIFVYIFSLYIIWVYVPADVPEIPVINERRRKRDKITSLIVLNLLFFLAMIVIKNNYYSSMIITTIFSIDVMTTRTMYKIFKNEYGYETYIPDELLTAE